MPPNDTAATLEVRNEHRIIVTAGTTITWLNIYEITDNQFYVVCAACNDSADTASRSAAGAWASQHARQVHTNGADNEFSALEPARSAAAAGGHRGVALGDVG